MMIFKKKFYVEAYAPLTEKYQYTNHDKYDRFRTLKRATQEADRRNQLAVQYGYGVRFRVRAAK